MRGRRITRRARFTAYITRSSFSAKPARSVCNATVHSPAVGTREQETTFAKGGVLHSLGRYVIPESNYDGNHVIVVEREAAWKRQVKLLGGYATFYNPVNLARALTRDGSPLRRRRIGYQLMGMVG